MFDFGGSQRTHICRAHTEEWQTKAQRASKEGQEINIWIHEPELPRLARWVHHHEVAECGHSPPRGVRYSHPRYLVRTCLNPEVLCRKGSVGNGWRSRGLDGGWLSREGRLSRAENLRTELQVVNREADVMMTRASCDGEYDVIMAEMYRTTQRERSCGNFERRE